jgi:hypothetical protein
MIPDRACRTPRKAVEMALMKETPESLRAYFIAAGLWTMFVGGRAMSSSEGAYLIVPVLTLGFGVAFVVAGWRLKPALLDGAKWILGLVLASGVLLILDVATMATMVRGPLPLIPAAIRFLLTWYLYASVQRLSAEARRQAGQTVVS